MPPSRWRPPWRKNKIEQEVTQLSTWTKWWGIWTDAWVCLHYWVVIWVAGESNFHLYCTVYGVCHRQNTMAVRSYSVLDILLPSIIIIMQDYWQALNTYNVCRVSCGGVFNMLLVLSTIFYFHYNIWGFGCSTWPFQYRWLKGYIYSSCYYHHQTEVSTFPIVVLFFVVVCLSCLLHHILSLIAYTFRENREFVFIIIVQFMMSANIRIRFGLQVVLVCLYRTPSHYHHCANFSEDIELIKCLSDIFCRVCKIKHVLSVIHYTICGAVCFQFTHYPRGDWENIYILWPYDSIS